MKRGDLVVFEGEVYTIKWVYDSGYCEIKHNEENKIKLVLISEITKV